MAWAFMAAKQEPSLRVRAMRFLARREHSRAELRRKLEPSASEGENIEFLLDDLARRGWLSDARFAEQSIRSQARRYGPLKVAHALRAKGIEDEAIAAAFRVAGEAGLSNLEVIWKSRFKALPADERERGRQVRFLQARGFPLEEVLRFLRQREKAK